MFLHCDWFWALDNSRMLQTVEDSGGLPACSGPWHQHLPCTHVLVYTFCSFVLFWSLKENLCLRHFKVLHGVSLTGGQNKYMLKSPGWIRLKLLHINSACAKNLNHCMRKQTCPHKFLSWIQGFFFFLYWGLNSGPWACQASDLPLVLYSQHFLH
jgi:hypothetical protein